MKRARAIRRRRMRERQALIFGSLVATLGVVGLGAVAVYTSNATLPFDNGFSYAEKPKDEVFPTACLPENTLPVSYAKIKVNIYNTTERPGLATAVRNDLSKRGLEIKDVGNSDQRRVGNAIVYGYKGLSRAYTLAAHFPDAALILDERDDRTVDVLIGDNFKALVPAENVPLEAETPMVGRQNCTKLWQLSDAVEPPEQSEDLDGEPEDAPSDESSEESSEDA